MNMLLASRERSDPPTGWRGRWDRFWQPPDPLLMDAGRAGELFTARVRFLMTAALLLMYVGQVLRGTGTDTGMLSVSIGLSTTTLAAAVLLLVREEVYQPSIAIATGILDVTIVSAVLVTFLAAGRPLQAVNSFVVYPCYLLAIAATALRYDARTCVVAGLVAIVEYLTLLTYVATRWDLTAARWLASPYGHFNGTGQSVRLLLIVVASVLATSAVLRTQHWLRQSASDRLTGLLNRGFFDDRLEEEWMRARRYGRPLAVAMIDIDHFKRFNDSYGHAAGDAALRLVAEKVSHALRRTDVVARYGGEELAVILPETSRASAAIKAEALRKAVEGATIVTRRASRPVGVTISVGVATWPDDGAEIREVLERADARLYSAKQQGRNRVSGALDPVPA